jgi:hypothetical protein
VLSVEVGETHAFSLAARLSSASAERFRTEVVVHRGGVCDVHVTATDVSGRITRAMLSALRDYLEEQGLRSIVVHLDGRAYVLSP